MAGAKLGLAMLVVLLLLAFGTKINYAGSGSSGSVSLVSSCSQLSGITVPSQCTSYQGNVSFNITTTVISLSLLALTISFLVVAIGYFISKLIPSIGVQGWLRSEYWEIGKTTMLIAGIFAIMTLISGVMVALYGLQSGQSTSAGAYYNNVGTLVNGVMNNYLCGQVVCNIEEGNDYLTGLAAGLGALRTTKVGLYIPVPLIPPTPVVTLQFGFIAVPYTNPMLDSTVLSVQYESALNDAMEFIAAPATLIIYAQIYMLPYLIEVVLVVLIPIGLILRALPFLRGIGGTLIAIGIGVGILYPSVLLFFNYPISSMLLSNLPTYSQTSLSYSGSNLLESLLVGIVNTVSSWFSGFAAGTAGVSDGLSSFFYDNLYGVMNGINYYLLFSLSQIILFVLDLMIVYPATDAIAKMLGGTIRLQLGGRMKLI